MKRRAINWIGSKMYSKKIKDYELRFEVIYKEDWSEKPWKDYAVDCFKFQFETKERIDGATGVQRMEFVCSLQALYNIRLKELDYVENEVLKLSSIEYKQFFQFEYSTILNNVKNQDLYSAMQLYSDYGQVANSDKIKRVNLWNYVSAFLIIQAIEEAYGNELSAIQMNSRSRTNFS
jgi:hypothetical protein